MSEVLCIFGFHEWPDYIHVGHGNGWPMHYRECERCGITKPVSHLDRTAMELDPDFDKGIIPKPP